MHSKNLSKQLDDVHYRIIELETQLIQYKEDSNEKRVKETILFLKLNKEIYKALTGRDYDDEMYMSGVH